MPARADFNPVEIGEYLPHVCFVDVERTTGRYKFRLIGSETVRVVGYEITGKYLDEIPLMLRNLKDRYDWLVKEKRPYVISDKLNWSDKSFFDFYSLGLPLSNNDRDVDILMYGSVYTLEDDSLSNLT